MSHIDNEDSIDIEGTYHCGTEKAILFSEDGDEENARWLPKSKIEYDEPHPKRGEKITVTIPIWLAKREWFL
jgi:hypothetical protein